MTLFDAVEILEAMQKWRRGEPPFDGDTPYEHREMPFTPKEFGEAIDMGINALNRQIDEKYH